MRIALVIAVMTILAAPAMAVDATFEDVILPGPESFYNGSDSAGGFTSGSFFFNNIYDTMFGSWEGFAASNITDNTTPGWSNQYSAIPGGGEGPSSNYAVGYRGFLGEPRIDFDAAELDGLFVTNSTYAYFSMLNGDAWAKKFGGADGTEEDWFLLTITGFNGAVETGSVPFYLADFRFADGGDDYIVDDWTWVDLASLGAVDALTFELASTDNGAWGMNTPGYFAMDSLAPAPATIAIDIKPGSDGNPVNLKSKGLLPVVIYGADGLDVSQIDLDTLLLNGIAPKVKNNGDMHVAFEDVDGDGLLDLVMRFDLQGLGILPGMDDLMLEGSFLDGNAFEGSDVIGIVPDFNGNFAVDTTDLTILATNFGTGHEWLEGDANGDGFIDTTDLTVLATYFGSTEGAPVPGPATMSVLAVGGMALLRRHRNRQAK